MITPASRITVFDDVLKQLIEIIKRGEWGPGEKITGEIELAKNFQVSRNSIREVLKALEHSGVLDSQPGRGTFVSHNALRNIRSMEMLWSLKQGNKIEDLIDARVMIEPELAYKAVERATPEQLEKMAQNVAKLKETYKNFGSSMDLGFEFHMIVAEMSHNQVLINFLSSITEELRANRVYNVMYRSTKEMAQQIQGHEQMYKFIKARQSDKIREYMRQHLLVSYKNLLNKNNMEI